MFIKQRQSGRLTITDDRMTRFWISLEEGVRFVIGCIAQMHGGEVFVPKIPSMYITDLAKVIAPDAKLDIIGIRPGEKLHEMLIHEDEARSTIDVDNMYVVLPTAELWFGREWESRGKALPEGFSYASNTNDNWLTTEQIRAIVDPFEKSTKIDYF